MSTCEKGASEESGARECGGRSVAPGDAWTEAVRLSAALYGVAVEAVKGRGRAAPVVWARCDAWYELRRAGWGWEALMVSWGVDRKSVERDLRRYCRDVGLVL